MKSDKKMPQNKYLLQFQKYFYQVWDTHNVILCRGRCMTGNEKFKYLGTFFLQNLPMIFYYIYLTKFFLDHGHAENLFFCILLQISVNLNYFIVGFRDPGIIPKIGKQYEQDSELLQIPCSG